jgi:glycyl-tRNA synthetase beta chain
VDVAHLGRGKKGKGEYLCVERVEKGVLARDHLSAMLVSALAAVAFPKTMYWESGKQRFARPVRWLALVADGKMGADSKGNRFSWAGLEAGNTTRGHRFLGSQEIAIASAGQYAEALRRNFVIVDHEERKRIVREGIAHAAASLGGRIVEDEDLLERVTFTVEYPLAIAGAFDRKFLEMPGEVIVTALKEHQEFFSVCDSGGTLLPCFVAVANLDKDRAGKIKLGNERVLKARLDDAHFYWEQDLKDGLDAMAGRLKQVVWQEQLGTLADKAGRMVSLSSTIAAAAGLGDSEITGRAALLAKADLTSLMVREKEFSSLQGLMGQEYAKALGEGEGVARAIFEHYLPRFAGDVLPETPAGIALALADKLDGLVGCFGIGLIPTGSEDPYALRRQATGFVRILMERGIHVSVGDLVSASIKLYRDGLQSSGAETGEKVLAFLRQRLQTLLVEAGSRADMVDGVLEAGFDDPALAAARLAAVKEFEADERFKVLVTAFKRAHNITKGEATGDVVEKLLEEKAEADLYASYRAILPGFNDLMSRKQFREAMALLLDIALPIDVFFGKVMVMVDRDDLKTNRLNLLGAITRRFLEIANFSRMESSS